MMGCHVRAQVVHSNKGISIGRKKITRFRKTLARVLLLRPIKKERGRLRGSRNWAK